MPKIRLQSKRAASKEAMKQMHNLLGGENEIEVSSDDDVIEVSQQPPKKKYKIWHKNDPERNVLVLKSVPRSDPCPFEMDAFVEPLTETQLRKLELLRQETIQVEEKIKQIAATQSAEVIHVGQYTTAYEISEQLQSVVGSGTVLNLPQTSQQIVLQPPNVATNTGAPQSYQLVMDPRLGVIVGTVANQNQTMTPAPPLQLIQTKVTLQSTVSPGTTTTTTSVAQPDKRRNTFLRQIPSAAVSPLHKIKKVPTTKTLQPLITAKNIVPKGVKPIMPVKGRPTTVQSKSNFRPESDPNTNKNSIDLTSDEQTSTQADSKEVSFNKLQGTTYPSLVVVARPHLRVKDLSSDRAKLDAKVKNVLMHPATKFTEWLIQQGLVRSEQKCMTHAQRQLKLGMYSDVSKFPHSGGYVWISECCPQRFVSVFSGSLFEGSQHPPTSILKLIYHWCCQTIVQNVTQWVKVDNLYVKNMYTWLRAICSVAIQSHNKTLGGYGTKVQIGVISLGTTSQDGNKREVKVEVLGILETTSRKIILRAIEPLPEGETNYKKRFAKILQPVLTWVHPGSHIIIDLTVDKTTLTQMGFTYVTQSTSMDYNLSNRAVMEYLRRIVPRMFQNTLSLLSRHIIQQFLDELVWREWYGCTVLECFENMLLHLSEQTRFSINQSLIARLNKVSADPFKDWSITMTTPNSTPTTPNVEIVPRKYTRVKKSTQSSPAPTATTSHVEKPAKSNSFQESLAAKVRPQKEEVTEQMVPLENYYYGSINSIFPKVKIPLNIRCIFCNMSFNTNIHLMNHLFRHAHNVAADAQLCRYCLTIVPDPEDLMKHIETSHPGETKFNFGFVCLICELPFKNPFILGKHMSQRHCPSELPYACGTCSFRCSNHKQAIDHFYQHHDYGTTIQCPFCLKSTTINSGGKNITQNMNFFIQHLRKHQKKGLAKKCPKCNLWFVQKEYLKYHQTKMHLSQRGKTGLVASFAPRNGVMVPKSHKDKSPDADVVINFQTLRLFVAKNLNCKECQMPLNVPKHFMSFQTCKHDNCKYSTCCAFAMVDHSAKCNSDATLDPGAKLPFKLYCVCGFSNTYGNTMARHLATCERKSGYSSSIAAKAATVNHSMLDVLGLVRKPEQKKHISKDEASSSSGKTLTKSSVAPLRPIILKSRRKKQQVEVNDEAVDDPAIMDEAQIKTEVETVDNDLSEQIGDLEKDCLGDEESKDGILDAKVSDKTDKENENVETEESEQNVEKDVNDDVVMESEEDANKEDETPSVVGTETSEKSPDTGNNEESNSEVKDDNNENAENNVNETEVENSTEKPTEVEEAALSNDVDEAKPQNEVVEDEIQSDIIEGETQDVHEDEIQKNATEDEIQHETDNQNDANTDETQNDVNESEIHENDNQEDTQNDEKETQIENDVNESQTQNDATENETENNVNDGEPENEVTDSIIESVEAEKNCLVENTTKPDSGEAKDSPEKMETD